MTVADEKGGQLEKRVMFYMDEIGTLSKVDGLEMIFSASRSRKVSIVAIIQSLAQFEKTYGKEGAAVCGNYCGQLPMHSIRSVRAQFQDRRGDVSESRKADRSQRLGIAIRKQGRLVKVIADDRASADDR